MCGTYSKPVRGIGAGLPILATRRGRADVIHLDAFLGLLLRIRQRLAGLQVNLERAGGMHKGFSRKDFTRDAVHDVHEAVTIRVYQRLAFLALDSEVDQHMLVDAVIVMQVVRVILQSPFG